MCIRDSSIAYNVTMLEMSTENFRDFELYAKLHNAKAVWKGTKLKFYKTTVKPILLYEYESWTLTRK